MLVRGTRALIVLALVFSVGAQWGALQTVAWAAMLARHLRSESISQAVCQTFDGRHPCCLCKAIATAKKSEKQKSLPVQTQKLEFPPLPATVALMVPSAVPAVPAPNSFIPPVCLTPPTPPPRPYFV